MKEWEYKTARDLDLRTGESLKSVRREIGLPGILAGLVRRSLLCAYLKIFHRIKIHGAANLPERYPFVLVSNHCSHLDAPVLSSVVPLVLSNQLFPIAAGDTFFESYASSAFAAFFMNALPLWRQKVGAHTMEHLRERLTQEPCAYILFPEGTRSRTSNAATFKPGIGRIVAGQMVPVVPCHIDGTFAAWPPAARFPRPRPITVTIGAPLDPSTVPNDKDGWKRIAESLQGAVEELARQSLNHDQIQSRSY